MSTQGLMQESLMTPDDEDYLLQSAYEQTSAAPFELHMAGFGSEASQVEAAQLRHEQRQEIEAERNRLERLLQPYEMQKKFIF